MIASSRWHDVLHPSKSRSSRMTSHPVCCAGRSEPLTRLLLASSLRTCLSCNGTRRCYFGLRSAGCVECCVEWAEWSRDGRWGWPTVLPVSETAAVDQSSFSLCEIFLLHVQRKYIAIHIYIYIYIEEKYSTLAWRIAWSHWINRVVEDRKLLLSTMITWLCTRCWWLNVINKYTDMDPNCSYYTVCSELKTAQWFDPRNLDFFNTRLYSKMWWRGKTTAEDSRRPLFYWFDDDRFMVVEWLVHLSATLEVMGHGFAPSFRDISEIHFRHSMQFPTQWSAWHCRYLLFTCNVRGDKW